MGGGGFDDTKISIMMVGQQVKHYIISKNDWMSIKVDKISWKYDLRERGK